MVVIATIDGFVNRRFEDAGAALDLLDHDFVEKVGSTVRLQRLGLDTPWEIDADHKPIKRLPSEWHRLLESCVELIMQSSRLETAAKGLMPKEIIELTDLEAGKRIDYNLRSWVIHANTLSERADEVIRKTVPVYIVDKRDAILIEKLHVSKTQKQLKQWLYAQRNQYAHGTMRSWAQGLTEDELWETFTVIQATPRQILDQFFHSQNGIDAKNGKFLPFQEGTEGVLGRLGMILRELEEDLASRENLKNGMVGI